MATKGRWVCGDCGVIIATVGDGKSQQLWRLHKKSNPKCTGMLIKSPKKDKK